MHPLKQDWVLVFAEPLNQGSTLSGTHDKRKKAQLVQQRTASLVVIYLVAVVGEFGLRNAIAVLITVKYDLDSLGMKRFNLVENDDDAAIVGGIGDVKRNDVEKHRSAVGWAYNDRPTYFVSASQR